MRRALRSLADHRVDAAGGLVRVHRENADPGVMGGERHGGDEGHPSPARHEGDGGVPAFDMDYRQPLERSGLRFSGFDGEGEPRILELPGHRFFVATLYVPQAAPASRDPHPVLAGFLAASKAAVSRHSDDSLSDRAS